MNNESSQHVEISQNQQQPVSSNHSDRSSYDLLEDEALCNAWIEVSMDPVVDNSQKSDCYWRRVKESYDEKMRLISPAFRERTANSLNIRNTIIHNEVLKFACFYNKLAAASWMTESSAKAKAHILYDLCSSGKKFALEHCWDILRHSKIFLDVVEKKNVANPNSEESEVSSDSSRPMGRKTAKRARSDDDRLDTLIELQKKQLEISEKKVKVMRDISIIEFLKVNPDHFTTPLQQTLYELLQRRIIREIGSDIEDDE